MNHRLGHVIISFTLFLMAGYDFYTYLASSQTHGNLILIVVAFYIVAGTYLAANSYSNSNAYKSPTINGCPKEGFIQWIK